MSILLSGFDDSEVDPNIFKEVVLENFDLIKDGGRFSFSLKILFDFNLSGYFSHIDVLCGWLGIDSVGFCIETDFSSNIYTSNVVVRRIKDGDV